MERTKPNSLRICNIICALLLLAIVVCQFLPFWNFGEGVSSIQNYLWFPEHVSGVTPYLQSALGNPDLTIDSLIGMPLLVVISGVLGIFLCAIKSNNFFPALIAAVCGISGVIGYLTEPAFQLGMNWIIHLILCFAILAMTVVILVLWIIDQKRG